MSNNYLRVRKEKGYLVLEAAVKTYHKNGLEVKLAGMDHVAKKDFFKKMFSTLDPLETILFEGTGVGKISKAQKESKFYKLDTDYKNGMLEYAHSHGLCYQTEIIPIKDYGKHWKHCDISLEEEVDKMEKSSKDLKYMRKEIEDMEKYSNNAKVSPAKKEESLYRQARGVQEMIVEEGYNIIIEYRNSLIIDKLRRLVNKKKIKRLGVMYGAEHMPGISGFLESQGFRLKIEKWVEAWRVKDLKKDYFD